MTNPLYARMGSIGSESASGRNRSTPGRLRAAAFTVVESLEGRVFLSTTLTPIADTFVRNHNYALTNYGASPLLLVKNAASGDTRISFIKFDLTGVTTISSATLELSAALQNRTATPVDAGIYAVADSTWVEGSGTIADGVGDGFDVPASGTTPFPLTWNNQPTIAATPLATATVTRDTYQTYSFDLTSYLQSEMSAGVTQVSLAVQNLEPTQEDTNILSRENTAGIGQGPRLIIGDTNPAPPAAIIDAPDVTGSTSPNIETVNVTYSGAAAIDPSTVDPGNIAVTPYGGGNALNVESNVGTTVNADGSVVATYTVDSPGGAWAPSDNGSYVVAVQAGGVQDVNGTGVTAAFGSFHISVGDAIAPTAAVVAPDVTAAGATTYTFNVTFSDNVAIDASTLALDNVAISGPVGPLKITGFSLSPTSGNASQIVATYTADAPSGGWTAADDGQYLVAVNASTFFDTAGNHNGGSAQPFNVNIAVPDTTPPTAAITAPNVTAPGGAGETITVNYADNVAVNASTVSANNLIVTGPDGTALAVTLVNVTGSGSSITATYSAAAPGGAWSASANGTYTVTVLGGQVTDTSNNPIAPTSATFNVSAALADIQPPTAVISAPAVNAAGGGSEVINVVYSDNVAVDPSSIGLANLSVSGPGGPLTVTSFSQTGSGGQITAKYTVTAPGGSWDASADGTYTIALNANQVKDTSGNVAAVTFGSFAVNIPLPNPTDSTFNNGNAVTGSFIAEAVATEPTGGILLVGHQATGSTSQGVIEALTSAGVVDTTFGTSGLAVTPAGNDKWFAVLIQGANHFIVAGTINGAFALARYDFHGNLDPTFGTGGIAVTSFGGTSDIAYALTIAPSGQIVAVGASNNRFAFARYDANGNIDTTFGEGGRQLFDTGATTQVLGAVAVQNDGNIVAAGASGNAIDVVRLTSTGEPDTTLSPTGMVAVTGLEAVQANGPDYTVALALQGDGKIVVANQTTSGHFGVARLTAAGAADSTFGAGGTATANFGGQDEANSVIIQGDGTILVVGTSLQNGQPLTAVAAFSAAGKLISSFGNGGLVTFGSTSSTRELHIGDLVDRAFGSATTDGKLLVGSSASGSQTVTSSIRRLIVPGSTSAPGIKETLLGVFGIVNGKKTRLVVNLGGGRKAIFTLAGGIATALQDDATGQIHLEITDSGKGAALTVVVSGGGTVTLSNIDVTGSLRSVKAKAAVVSGTLTASGSLGAVALGNVASINVTGNIASLVGGTLSGTLAVGGSVGALKLGAITGRLNITGNLKKITAGDLSGTLYTAGTLSHATLGRVTGVIAAAANITSLSATGIAGATILAGANLGDDGRLGGAGAGADTFAAGVIGTLHTAGAIDSSFIGAGVNPVDGVFGNGNDTSAGASLIKSIFAKGGATQSVFEASAFGKALLPKKVDPATDPRFKTL